LLTGSGANTLVNIGTLKATSGSRLYGPLTGIDVPTLRDVWNSAPYLHDGSAPTLGDAVRAHNGVMIDDASLADLVAYLREIGSEESEAPQRAGSGTELRGSYYNNSSSPLSSQQPCHNDFRVRGFRPLFTGITIASPWVG
jgi:hypothetical protein